MSYNGVATAMQPMSSGTAASPLLSGEEERLYSELFNLRDAVLAGRHPQFVLPADIIAQLKASLSVEQGTAAAGIAQIPSQIQSASVTDGTGFASSLSANHTQSIPTQPTALPDHAVSSSAASISAPSFTSQYPTQSTLPGLLPGLSRTNTVPHNANASAPVAAATASGLNPIFLEKSDELVRAEDRLKRQRVERELQGQPDQHKRPAHNRDVVGEVSLLDVDAIFARSQVRQGHVSGLKPTVAAQQVSRDSEQSSFDENDYYSSQVESEWSSPVPGSKHSDVGVAAASKANATTAGPASSSHNHDHRPAEVVEIDDDDGDEDDEYDPADTTVVRHDVQDTLDDTVHGEGDESDEYEPGEITPEGYSPPLGFNGDTAHRSPQVPVIRNHLTHIAAPQPNRVSPLAVAKVPSMGELQLINGRPEFVKVAPLAQHVDHSQGSDDSRDAGPGSRSKRKAAKRKRRDENRVEKEPEHTSGAARRSKRIKKVELEKQQQQNNRRVSGNEHNVQSSYVEQQPYIKNEPISPNTELHRLAEQQVDASRTGSLYRQPTYVDLVSPRQNTDDTRGFSRYAAQPQYRLSSPAPIVSGSPVSYRPVQRDTQDLRRVASMQFAQRPASPGLLGLAASARPQYRTVSMPHGDRLSRAPESQLHSPHEIQYVRSDRSRSPPRLQEYRDVYARQPHETMMMPPPAAPPPRQIFVDQHGNQYYAEPAPAPVSARASMAPPDRRQPADAGYERAPSRMASVVYESRPQYGRVHDQYSMAPPALPASRAASVAPPRAQYVDANGYAIRESNVRARAEPEIRYVRHEAPTSPLYQPLPPQYERAASRMDVRDATAAPPPSSYPAPSPSRSYSVRPEEMPPPFRAGSVAPMQYSMPPPPPPHREYARGGADEGHSRAVSVAPGYELQHQIPEGLIRALSVAPGRERASAAPPYPQTQYQPQQPQQVRYIDQDGREVFPQQVRSVSAAGGAGQYYY